MGFTENKRPRHRAERRSEIFTVPSLEEVFLRRPEAITNSAPPVQLGGVDTADFMTEKQ